MGFQCWFLFFLCMRCNCNIYWKTKYNEMRCAYFDCFVVLVKPSFRALFSIKGPVGSQGEGRGGEKTGFG